MDDHPWSSNFSNRADSDAVSKHNRLSSGSPEGIEGSTHASERPVPDKITRACDRCRKKKIKCDWEIPSCSSCTKRKTPCVYTPTSRAKRRDKTSTRAAQLETRLIRMEELLKNKRLPPELKNPLPNTVEIENGAVTESSPTKEYPNSEERDLVMSISENENTHQSLFVDAYDDIELSELFDNSMSAQWPFGTELTPDFQQHTSSLCSMNNDSQSNLSQLGYMDIPPKPDTLPLIKLYFSHLNRMFPLFSEPVFMEIFHDLYVPGSYAYQSSAAWCSIHVILAIANCLLCMTPNRTGHEHANTMDHIQKAVSLSSDILLNGSDLLSVQALLGVATVLQGTSSPRSYSILIAASARLAHIIRLHQEVDEDSGLTPAEIEQRKRVFWLVNILDKDISLRSRIPPLINLDDADVSFPGKDGSGPVGCIYLSDGNGKIDILGLRIQLSMISAAVYQNLYSSKAAKHSEASRALLVQNLDDTLMKWRNSIHAELSLSELVQRFDGFSTMQLLVLYSSYFHVLTMVHRRQGPTKFKNELSTGRVQSFDPLQYGPHVSCVKAASEFIFLINSLPPDEQGHLWLILYSAASAIITLLHCALHNPQQPKCAPLVESVGSMIDALPVLSRTCEDPEVLRDVHRMHTFCVELRRRAVEAMNTYQELTQSFMPNITWIMPGT